VRARSIGAGAERCLNFLVIPLLGEGAQLLLEAALGCNRAGQTVRK
jgi:hypothetical protein